MADNNPKPSLTQVSHALDSESPDHHSSGSFATLPSGSGDSAIGSLDTTRVEYNSSTPTNERRNKRQLSAEAARYMLVSRNPNSINHNEQEGDMVTTWTTPVSKRPPGRPRGSKNKPKPPMQQNDTMIPILIEVHPGNDVVESIINVARSRHMGIYIHSGIGLLSYAVIRRPFVPGADIHVEGPVTLVSLGGSYLGGRFVPLPLLPQLHPFRILPSPTCWSLCSSFAVVLSGVDALAFGGIVVGKILAADIVRVMAVLVKEPEFIRFPLIFGNNGGDHNNDKGGGVGNSDAPFATSTLIKGAKDVAAAAEGDGGGGGSASEDNKSSTTNNNGGVNTTNNNGGVNYSTTLPYISSAYGFAGLGTCVCNVSVMQ